MKFSKTVCIILAAIMMIAVFAIPASAYQSALPSGKAFSDTARAKMAAMEPGDNIFAMGDFTGTAADFNKSGDCQFCYQNNNDKWGRAYKGDGWAIDGMAKIGDGVFDSEIVYKGDHVMYFGVKSTNTVKVNANAEPDKEDSKYLTLCGWEFAADFTVDSFKIYFGQNAYADDFDILIGHLDNDAIVWETAFEGNDLGSKFTAVEGAKNAIVSYTADFDKAYTGRFIQIAVKTFDGHGLNTISGRTSNNEYGYVCTEFEVYTANLNPDTADSFDAVTFSVILAVSLVGALAAGYTVIRRRKEN